MKHYIIKRQERDGKFRMMAYTMPLVATDAVNWSKSYRANNPQNRYKLEFFRYRDDY